VCTAVRIVVAASTRERRLELRRAAVTAEWEVVGDAEDANGAFNEAVEGRARFLVLDASAASPNAFVVGVGDVAGVDATVGPDDLTALRDTMAGLLHDSGDHTH
jgi:hypothetical protein